MSQIIYLTGEHHISRHSCNLSTTFSWLYTCYPVLIWKTNVRKRWVVSCSAVAFVPSAISTWFHMSIIIDLLGEIKPPNNLNIASIQAPGTDQIFAGVSLYCGSLDLKKSIQIHSPSQT